MTRSLRIFALAPVALVASSAVLAAPDPAARLIAAEDAYSRAIVGKDVAVLGNLLSEDLIYVHASGLAEDKSQYLKGTVDGGWRVQGAQISERRATVYGKVGVTLGKIAYNVGGGDRVASYMAVYHQERGKWLLLRWQNAKPTAPANPAGSN